MKLINKTIWRKCTFLLAFIMTMCSPIFAQSNTQQQLDSLFNSLHSLNKFNGIVLIAEQGKPIYEQSFGFEDFDKKITVGPNSVFELASCSKQFTAFAIALLQYQGKLDIKDDITKWLPALTNYKGITIQNLIHHTSGLPDYMELFDSLWDKSKIATNEDISSIFSKHKPTLLFKPNSKYEYSNTGYALLASIIEQSSGKSYATYLKENIFSPLQMNQTFVYNRRYKPQKVKHYSLDYIYDNDLNKFTSVDSIKELDMLYYLDGISGDGTVNATAQDLLKWDQALYTNKLLPAAMREQLFATTQLNDGSTNNYAFGWMMEDNKDIGTVAAHSGGWGGYRSYIERHLKSNKTIIILQNIDRATIPVASVRLLLEGKPLPKPVTRTAIDIPIEVLAQYEGEYELAPDYVMTITRKENQLYTQLTGQAPLALFPEKTDKFFLKAVEAQLEFIRDDKDQVTKAILYQNGNTIEAIKKK